MKYDLKKDRKDLYAPGSHDFVRVTVPSLTYLAIDGHGDPNTAAEYTDAVSALYASGYAIKFAFRARSGDDFVVGPLEGLWSSDDPSSFAERRKDAWDWTMLIPLPPAVTDADIRVGLDTAARKKPELPIDRGAARSPEGEPQKQPEPERALTGYSMRCAVAAV